MVLTPATSRNAEAALQGPVTLTVGAQQMVDSLNPLVGYLSMSYEVYTLMYEMLVGVDKDLNPCPQIAESWSVSADLLIWTYNIRHGMTWHDGVSVTAQDVNWTFNMIMDDPVAGALSSDYLRNVTDCRAIDDYTLKITTEVPKATMLSIVIPIMPKHLWETVPTNKRTSVDVFDTTYFPNGPVGSGPFKLVQYVTDDFVKFEKYTGYYGATVRFDILIYKLFLSPQAMLNALYAGTVDIAAAVPYDSWQTTLDQPYVDGYAVDELVLTELGINVCPPSLRVGGASTNYETLNLSVRKAMRMAIDGSQIVDDAVSGLGQPGDVLVPPASVMWHYNVTDAERMPASIVAANDLLNRSGYNRDDDGDKIRENETSGKELSFLFEYIIENPEDDTAAYMIYDMLLAIGISATPKGVSEASLSTDWIGMKYDMFIWGWGGDADPSFILSVMTTDQIPQSHNDWAAWSDCYYSNPHYDALFIQQQNAVDITERQSIIYEMQRILYLDSPYIVLYNGYGTYAFRTDRFANWPDMASHPGMTPMTGLTGGPWMFFEIVPIEENLPPQLVDAGQDTQAALNQTKSFTGSAQDEDPATSLNWTWTFTQTGFPTVTLYGQTVEFKFEHVGSVSVTLKVTDTQGLYSSETIKVTVIELAEQGWFEGWVTNATGGAIMAALVTAGLMSATTNVTGYYNMTVAPGTYNVSADAQGYLKANLTAVVALNETTVLNFTLVLSSGTLRGTIKDADSGDPIGGALVTVENGSFMTQVLSNATTGAYRITMIDAGDYSVNVTKTGYENKTTTATINMGAETVLDIELTPVEKGGGLSTAAIAAIVAIIVIVVLAIVTLMLMKRKKGSSPETPPPEKPPKP